MASSSKNQGPAKRTNLRNGRDMISNLPDELLVHILSFLTTKDAFRTGLLSSRWENLWTAVPNLDLRPKDSFFFGGEDKDPRYMDFIRTIISLHNSNVNKFHMDCTPAIDIDCLCDWISKLVKHNVQDIDIRHFDTYLKLPRSLFTCKTLVSLKLSNFLALKVPTSIHFPRLKVLHISVDSPSSKLTKNLFCSSPMLEDLRIDVDRDYRKSIYNISSPCLKKLVLSIKTFRSAGFNIVVNIDAPILEYLEVAYAYAAHYILKNSHTLVKAKVSADLRCCHPESIRHEIPLENLTKLLKSVSFVKDLSLDGRFPAAVFSSFENKWPVFASVTSLELEVLDYFDTSSFSRWPKLPNLTHLQLKLGVDFASIKLSDLLALVPKLASLVFVQVYSRIDRREFNCSEQSIPSCFRSCLKEIELRYFEGSVSELNLLKYLLVNAQVLEKLTVTVANYISKDQKAEEFISKIDMMPKCSKNFELKII